MGSGLYLRRARAADPKKEGERAFLGLAHGCFSFTPLEGGAGLRSIESRGRLGGREGPRGRVGAMQRLLIKRLGMARYMPPKEDHGARGGAPIAVRIASPVPKMMLIAVGRGGPG